MGLRICVPDDPIFDVDNILIIENEYKYPDMHIKKNPILIEQEEKYYKIYNIKKILDLYR